MPRVHDAHYRGHELARANLPRGRAAVRERWLHLRGKLSEITCCGDKRWVEFLQCGVRLREYDVADGDAVMRLPVRGEGVL